MKKHILGFTIFAIIVGSFISVWALLGYFTQTIPNVPKVESDNLPVFTSDKKTSCFKQRREKISFDIDEAYYFADTKKIVSTIKLKWNGVGEPPEQLVVTPKIYTADNKILFSNKPQTLRTSPNLFKKEYYVRLNLDLPLNNNDLEENLYANFEISSESGEKLSSDKNFRTYQVIVVHGESSVINR